MTPGGATAAVRGPRRVHRVIWIGTGIIAALAAATTGLRHYQQTMRHAPVRLMMEALQRDPYQEDAATREAIVQAAGAAEAHALTSAEAWYAVGLQHMTRHDFDGAENAFKNAVVLRPDWSWPYNELGILLANHTRHRQDEAERALKTAIRLEPQRGRPYNDLAILYRVRKHYEQAERAAKLALELSPNSVAANNNYGNLLVIRKRYKEAEPYYRKAVDLAPAHPKPYYNLACLYCLLDRKDEALESLRKAVAIDPNIRDEARKDSDLYGLRRNAEFRRLTAAPKKEDSKP